MSSFTLVFLGSVAALQLMSYGRIVAAEKFIDLQQTGINAKAIYVLSKENRYATREDRKQPYCIYETPHRCA